jgi:carboxyl-terminal processing protease
MTDSPYTNPVPDPGAPASDVQPEAAAQLRPHRVRPLTIVALFLVAVVGGAGLFMSGFALGRLAGSTPGTAASQEELFRPFWDAYNDVTTDYVGTVDQHALVEGAINGIFQALGDPFSFYMTEEQYQASLSGLSGEFEGVGIEMTLQDAQGQSCDTISDTCQVVITNVIRGAPAVTAGLLAGDVIQAVDGKALTGMTLDAVVPLIRGPRHTTVTLTIERAGARMDVPVTRDVVQREDVTSEVLAGGKVGYIKIADFSAAAASDFHDQLLQLVDTDHVSGVVLDLRDDPGGYVDAAQQVASEFVSTTPLYWEETANQAPQAIAPLPGGVATNPALPVAVLVNGGTASASEIVSASLQGNHRAVLIGQQTYGKGTIQEFK